MILLRCFLLVTFSLGFVTANPTFKPSTFPKKTTICTAIKRSPIEEKVNITLGYVELNPRAPTTLLMVHGWPSLWSTWSYQIQEFQDDYHLIVPDLRGFAESTHPGDVRASGTMADMVGDLVCILKSANVQSAICMGHDWGSQICFEAARMRPDIFTAVIGAVIPYMPAAGPFVPIKDLTTLLPALTYQIYFDSRTEDAVLELDNDVRRTIRATLRTVDSPPPDEFLKSNTSYLSAWSTIPEARCPIYLTGCQTDDIQIPPVPFFTPEEEDYFVEQFSLQGFKNTLQFYTTENRHQSWEIDHRQGNFTISQPVLAIYPSEDPVANWELVAKLLKSSEFTPQLTTEVTKGAHWVHLEHSNIFNMLVRAWLSKKSLLNPSRDEL
ncbi:Alpha/Beta hydrolase protein [Crucibulum laeve]|uniref:Alpha/Beta hydrolase protein n=1 Tax=Crucibulum laeve TaxID=68775 RepID=A0A5C3LSM2_9AGAR|nr:Alpha/Beta hydrolase protein [Crucibulum laeve]